MTENKFKAVQAQSPEGVQAGMLTAMPYGYAGRRNIAIEIRQPEFTSVCPMTGLPDYGAIMIQYQPDKQIIELKSLKYYLLQFRNVGIFYEHVVNKILDDLVDTLKPVQMTVSGEFTARGGITTRVQAEYQR